MPDSLNSWPSLQPLRLVLQLAIALFLFASWAYFPSIRTMWDALDQSWFFTLNGSLKWGYPWQVFWAFANSRAFDVVAALALLVLLLRFVLADGRQYVHARLAMCIFLAIWTVLTMQVGHGLIEEKRMSPSMVLTPVHYLTEMVPWMKTKDRATSSFPGDHASVLWMFTLFFCIFGGKWYAARVVPLAFFFMMPRFVAGAHWFSDMGAGALPLALASTAIAFYTPIITFAVARLTRMLQRPFFDAWISIGLNPETPHLALKGACMGTADIIPGVSGGTMAYILGIWHRLMCAIKSFDIPWVLLILKGRWTEATHHAHLAFAVPLVAGLGTAVVIFTKIIPLPQLLTTHPEPIYGLFFGLIAGSIAYLLKETGKLDLNDALTLVIGTVLGWMLVTLVPVQTPETWWFLMFAGMISISAMLLPGISGSFILLILGKYAYVLDGLGRLDFTIILPFAGGCLVGLLAFSHVAVWMLREHYRLSVLTITGILVVSLLMIWPFKHRIYETLREKERLISSAPTWPESLAGESLLAIILALAGLAAVWWLHRLAERHQQSQTHPHTR